MSVSNLFAAAMVAAISSAVYSTTPYEVTSEDQSMYDDYCFHCIDMGNIFCSADGQTGKCLAASCEEDKLSGQEKKATFGTCTLRDHACDDSSNTGLVAIVAYSLCTAPA